MVARMPEGELKDGRSPVAIAMSWASQVTSVAIEMVVPAALGHFLDQWLGTRLVFLVLGGIAGFGLGMLALIRLAKSLQRQTDAASRASRDKSSSG